MSISVTMLFDFFFTQLGYVIYRRVLRYYSGEEDGLGEHLNLTILTNGANLLFCFIVNNPFHLPLLCDPFQI